MSDSQLIFAVGGGEIRQKTTLAIDREIVAAVRVRTGERRPNALMLPTASHDCMPYFNSFRKTYTSVLDCKADVALLSREGLMDRSAIAEKIALCDLMYVGGGDTKYMLEVWQRWNLVPQILAALQRGAILAGLSAGAICWFTDMYTDYDIVQGGSNEYKILRGLGLLQGTACPHYDERQGDFDPLVVQNAIYPAYGIENDAALVFQDGKPVKTLSAGGRVFLLDGREGLYKEEMKFV